MPGLPASASLGLLWSPALADKHERDLAVTKTIKKSKKHVHPFIRQIFIEHLLGARLCKQNKVPVARAGSPAGEGERINLYRHVSSAKKNRAALRSWRGGGRGGLVKEVAFVQKHDEVGREPHGHRPGELFGGGDSTFGLRRRTRLGC